VHPIEESSDVLDGLRKSVSFSLAPCPAWALEFGHFHCRVAASDGRPVFQGRSGLPNPIPRRGATDEMVNLNGVRDSSAADGARFSGGGTKDRPCKAALLSSAAMRRPNRRFDARQLSPLGKTGVLCSELGKCWLINSRGCM